MKYKRTILLVIYLGVILSLLACNSEEDATNDNNQEDQNGKNILTVAYDNKPPGLDPHITTATITKDFTSPIFETLVALDSELEPQPMLAEEWEISEDGKTYTFKLREGVKFHNGKEMTSEDVIASYDKWVEVSSLGKSNFADATFEAEDDYTVVMQLPERNTVTLIALSNTIQYLAIMPKEIVENAGADGITEYIGTGPYEVKEWRADQYLHLKKFEDYQPLSTPADGFAGKKEVLVDELHLEIVDDASTRVAGLISGQYDMATLLPYDDYDRLENDPNITVYTPDNGFAMMVFNKKHGFFSDVKARQAINYALDLEEVLLAAYSSEKFAAPSHALVPEIQTSFYREEGIDRYNQKDIEKAKELLDEIGYNGEEIVFLVSRAYEDHYNAAVSVQQQLKEVGINVKLDVYDWATLLTHREDETAWDMFATGFSYEPHPLNNIWLDSATQYPGWTNSSEIDSFIDQIRTAASPEEASDYFGELQDEFYNYLPLVKYGDTKNIHATRSNIKGYDYSLSHVFWNISKE